MPDQAHLLRSIVQRRQTLGPASDVSEGADAVRATTIAMTSGKGGVGKSNLALNLGIALAQLGSRVCLLDANLGLGNLDLLCGLNGYWHLAHVITGARTLQDVALRGPGGVTLIPGASGIADAADCPTPVQKEILAQLETLERDHDFLIIDTGTGIHRSVRQFVAAADTAIIISTPEPTSIADAYATIKALSGSEHCDLCALINQAESSDQAQLILERIQQTARLFLHRSVTSAGFVPRDACVPAAVARRTPFLIERPDSPASVAIHRIARRLRHRARGSRDDSFFPRLWQRLARKAA